MTNNDTETVTIYAGISSPPTAQFGTLAAGAIKTITIGSTAVTPIGGMTFYAYVQMKATGRTDSGIVSDESNGFGE